MSKELRTFKKHYPELDLVRSAAITLVLLLHMNESIFRLPADAYMTRFFAWGYNGVDLFFVLSGFLIGGQIIEENLQGGFDFKRFYIKRILRIFPPYYFAIIAYVVISTILLRRFILADWAVQKDVFFHLVYLQNYFHPKIYGGIYWTLAVEEHFYIIIPLLLYIFIRYLGKHLLPVLVFLILAGISVRFMLYDGTKEWWYNFYMPSHVRMDTLLFGVLAAGVFVKYRDALKGLTFPWRALMVCAGLGCLFLTYLYGGRVTNYFNVCWQYTLTGLGFALLILSMTAFSTGAFVPFKWLFAYIAKHSYTMYLYHLIIQILLVNIVFSKMSIQNDSFLNFFLVFLVYFAVTLGISALIYQLVDKRCMKYRKKITQG